MTLFSYCSFPPCDLENNVKIFDLPTIDETWEVAPKFVIDVVLDVALDVIIEVVLDIVLDIILDIVLSDDLKVVHKLVLIIVPVHVIFDIVLDTSHDVVLDDPVLWSVNVDH